MSEEKLPDEYKKFPVKAQDFTLFTSHVELKLPNGMTKAISLGDFISALTKTVKQENILNALLLPANCYVFAQSITEMKLSCYYPGKQRKVVFYRKNTTGDNVEYIIPFPNIIITHWLRKRADSWEHQDARYFATSKTIGQLDGSIVWERDDMNQLWVLPFANIYPEGRLCQGHNTLPKIFKNQQNLRGLDWHFAVLYNSSFNEDLSVPSLAKSRKGAENWYKELTGYKTFPYDQLKYGEKAGIVGQTVAQEVMADIEVQPQIDTNALTQTIANDTTTQDLNNLMTALVNNQ